MGFKNLIALTPLPPFEMTLAKAGVFFNVVDIDDLKFVVWKETPTVDDKNCYRSLFDSHFKYMLSLKCWQSL